MIRRRYQVNGRVQGVGFRYTVVRRGSFIRIDGYEMTELALDRTERSFNVRR